MAVLFGVLAGCSDEAMPKADKRKKVRIAVVGTAKSDPDWPILVACAPTALRFQDQVEVEVRAGETPSPTEQRAILAALVAEPFDAVCVMPIDADAIRPEIAQLARSGKPVVTFGVDVPLSERVSFHGPHEEEIGHAAAAAVLDLLPSTRVSVGLIGPGAGSARYGARYRALKERLAGQGRADIIREADCTAEPWAAAELVRNEAKRYPRMGCWVFLDDWPLKADKDWSPLVPDISSVVVCSGSPRWFARLKRREIHALITYNLQRAVEGAVSSAINAARQSTLGIEGRDLPVEIVTPGTLPAYEKKREAWLRGERAGD